MTSGNTEQCCELCTSCLSMFKQATRLSGITSPARGRCKQDASGDKENSALSPCKMMAGKQLTSGLQRRQSPLEEHADSNSQDSGLEMAADPATFRFAEPLGVAPRKSTPRKEMAPQCLSPVSPRAAARQGGTTLFHCLSSGSESIDDGFLDFLCAEKEDDDANFPTGMSSLLSGKIMRRSPLRSTSNTSPSSSAGKLSAKRSLHRSLSLADCETPTTSRARSCLFSSPSKDSMIISPSPAFAAGFKRPQAPTPLESLISPQQPPSKRRKSSHTSPSGTLVTSRSLSEDSVPRGTLTQSSLLNYGFQRNKTTTPAPKLQRSYSESEASIKRALQRSLTEPDLIGDFSRPFVLPLMDGRHTDLKTISCDTLASLVKGEFNDSIASFSIVDCRYPYEYEGGHIKGALNLFTKELVQENLVTQPPSSRGQQRHILVFHCEFSCERAPSMSRYLRNMDRDVNKECYPRLHYPEMYLLHGGYKAFFESHAMLCEPQQYVPMLSQGNEADLKHFRAKSRSWAGDVRGTTRLPAKFSLKRLDV